MSAKQCVLLSEEQISTLKETSELIAGSVKSRALISEIHSFKEPYTSRVLTLHFNCFAIEPVSPGLFKAVAC